MKISRAEALQRKVDDAITIEEIHDGSGFSFDVAIGRISGHHRTVVNRVSDRCYFILDGEVDIQVGDKTYHAIKHDTVMIPVGVPHGVDGTGHYLVITSPPFAAENEVTVE